LCPRPDVPPQPQHTPTGALLGSACVVHPRAARSVWPWTNDLGAVDLSARSGADRVCDAVADRQIWVARRDWETREVPSITGRVEVNLTVRDPLLSAAWYAELLGMQTRYDHTSADGQMCYICLVEPSSSLVLCLVGHAKGTGESFSEFRTGLDHLEFLVSSRDDLEHWAQRLDELGVPHSGVKNPDYTANAMLTFRDPDNIQLEFFWRATAPGGA
jgi:glyoxylase I family protein